MSEVHWQTAVRFTGKEDGEVTTMVERTHHMATEVVCPRCHAAKGTACRSGNGTLMPTLSVHRERVEAFL